MNALFENIPRLSGIGAVGVIVIAAVIAVFIFKAIAHRVWRIVISVLVFCTINGIAIDFESLFSAAFDAVSTIL